ncbi:hypothetical protein LG71_03460 [Pluralibacter gergoviae]|uniref:hypothetical protein n=1 Tax=Pluralibacter gergoviae TaxID=61647 RepID=UPI0004F80DF9|nr:hypothetical protein [Pluralibacter gergoviae]AIQ99020.1 hypothetical protein LG71_03460 [Pluralibacter gergoviae]MCV7760777.1 hypothetical protein [Pluralibacter gergoviae]
MNPVSLSDSICRVQQAQELLSLWLESTTNDDRTNNLLGGLLTLLDGIPDVMDAAEGELFAMDALKRSGGKA